MKDKLLTLVLTLFSFFTQAQIPALNLQLWLKTDVGVTPNTNNALVTLWADQSGNNNSLTGVAGGFDGTGIYVINGSQRYIQFPNSSYLRKTSGVVWPANSSAITIFVVHAGALSATQSTSFFNLSATPGFDLSQGVGFPATNVGAPVFRNSAYTVPFSTVTGPQVSTVVFTANNAASTACQTFRNGVLVNGAATTGSSIPATISALTLGSLASGNSPLRAYEIIAYSEALNATDRQTVENYLLAKYSAVLPLALVNFIATIQNKSIELYWQTESEINTQKFEIEHSSNGNRFETIGTITAANKNGRNEYTFSDNNFLTSGARFYRLKIIDIDGKFKYSNVIKVSNHSVDQVKIFPNPATDIITISGMKGKGQLQLFNTDGKLLLQKNAQVQNETLDISRFTKGVYILKYINGEKIIQQKLIK